MVESSTQPSDSRLLSILTLAKMAVLVKDENGCYVFANSAADALLGYGPGALTGKYMADLCPAEPALIEMSFRRLKRDGAWSGRFTMRHAAGHVIEVAGQAFVHTGADGSDLYVDLLYPVDRDVAGKSASASPGSNALTPRDVCLLQLMVEAFSDEELAVLLGISVSTVRAAIGGILRKMNAASRTEACVQAIKRRLVV